MGTCAGWGGSQRLARVIGVRRALDLMFSARWLDAEDARSFGLANYVVDDGKLHHEAMAYCMKLAERSRTGLYETKHLRAREPGSRLRMAWRSRSRPRSRASWGMTLPRALQPSRSEGRPGSPGHRRQA